MNVLKYKISLNLETPLIVGGKKIDSNYIKSMDYIPGSVFRAALARELLNRCSYYDASKEKLYWVEFQNKSHCSKCPMKNLCKNFSNIKLSFLYPFDSKPYANTNMRCKYDSSHKDVDTLIYHINRYIGINAPYQGTCPNKNCGQRLEKHTGLGYHGKDVEGIYQLITKNGIDPFTKRSKENILYSLDVLSEKMFLGDEERHTEFYGTLESNVNISKDLENFKSIRLGAYITSGFGLCSVNYTSFKDNENENTLKRRVEEFNKYIDKKDKYYIALTLVSDAYLGLENTFNNKAPSSISKDDYLSIYQEILKPYLDFEFNFEFPMINVEWRRGFDTSKKISVHRNQRLLCKAGSIFVISVDKSKLQYNKLYTLEQKGIGENTEHGFGKIEVCGENHIENRMTIKGDY